MTVAQAAPRTWSSQRWLAWVTLVFAAQLGLILWLSDHKPIRVRAPVPAPTLQLAGEASAEMLGLQDATLFALPNSRSFSGAAWLEAPQPEFRPPPSPELPQWLRLPVQDLGATFTRFVQTNDFKPWRSSAIPQPEPTLPEEPARPEIGPERSTFRFLGGLAQRRLLATIQLPSWPHADLLAESVVQLVVDATGRALSVVLLASSGAKEADDYALSQARAARFAPLANTGPDRLASPLAGLTWGEMVFDWRTLPVAPTNMAPPAP